MKASVLTMVCKGTVHKTGKLGFNSDASDYMELNIGKSALIFMNEEDSSDVNLYVKLVESNDEPDAFKISKAGNYFYLNCKGLFDALEIDYVNDNVVYYIKRKEIEGETMFEFKRKDEGSGGSSESGGL